MKVELLPVLGLPEVTVGDDLGVLIAAHADLADGDVLVVSQKVVSKAEGALARPAPGEDPAAARRRIAREQATRVVADTPQVLIVQTAHGFVCANAGIDASNVPDGALTLLPVDPDASARGIRRTLAEQAGVDVGVIIADTFGRPWRVGQTDVAIGIAGLDPIRDERGGTDRHGALLAVTEVALADELAAAADLVRRKADGVPVVLVRGLGESLGAGRGATALVRAGPDDLFRRGAGMLAEALASAGSSGGGPAAAVSAAVLQRSLELAGRAVPAASFSPSGDGRSTVIAVTAADRLETGAAAMALVAILVDLGCVARWALDPDGVVRVRAGATPEPEVGSPR